MLPNRVLFLLALLYLVPYGAEVHAQAYAFQFRNRPLAEAVEEFKQKTDIDVVYSPDLIANFVSSCSYRGSDALEALMCIVQDGNLEIRAVSEKQYILVSPPRLPSERDEPRNRRGFISGFVLDRTTGESLYGATVYLPGLRVGATSNEAGYFALPALPPGVHRIRISYVGYAANDTTLSVSDTPHILSLKSTAFTMQDVVVERAYTGRSDLAIIPGLVATPVRQLESLPGTFGGRDVLEVLGWMSGIQRAGEATGGLVVRGSGPDQNLYMIDGAPIYHPWHAFTLISTFQTETFKDLKFYRGSFPAEYGGRLSAVLDAELRDGRNAEPSLVASINPLNARFLIESALGANSSFMLSGRRSYLDKLIGRNHPVSDGAGRRDTLRTGYYFYDWSAKFSFSPRASTRISISYYSGRDDLDLRLPFDLSLDFSSWLRPADLFFEVDQDWGNTLYNIRVQQLVSSRVFLSGTFFHSEYSANEAARIQPTLSAYVNSAYAVKLRDLGARFDLDYFPALTHQIRTGATIVDHRFQSAIDAVVTYSPSLEESLVEGGDIRAIEAAAYVQDHWTPSERFDLLLGTRLSYFGNGSFFRLSPRMSFRYAVDPRLLLVRGSLSSQVQYLQRIRDRYSYVYDLVSSRWIPSGSSVEPSRGLQAALGGESEPWPWFRLSVEGFIRSGRGVILPRDEYQSKNGLLGPGIDISTLLGQYTKGHERSLGIEVESNIRLQKWQFLVAYTGSQSRNRTPELDDNLYRPARFDVPHNFSAVAQRSLGRLEVSLSVIWRAGYPTTVPIARYSMVDPLSNEESYYYHFPSVNNGRLPPYFRTDVGLGYEFGFLEASWSARIHVYNVFNRRNVIGRTFDPQRESFVPKDSRGLPLLPLFELEMRL